MLNKVVLLIVLGTICTLDLPPEMQKCKRSDPKFDECLSKAIEHALPILVNPLPEFNFDGIDPIKIPSLSIGAGAGAVHVTQNYKNVELHNIQNSKIKSLKSTMNDNDFEFFINSFLDFGKLEGEYSLDGNILVFPIIGNGTCTITLHDTKSTYYFAGEILTKNDDRYANIKDVKIKLIPEKVSIDLRNLFNGDEVLGREMNKLLNENWKDVFEDVIHKYEEVLSTIFKRITNLIFNKVPYDNIFLP